jgi:hypothetical protein
VGAGLSVAPRAGRRRLELRVGPLRSGGAERVLGNAAVAGVGPLIERLVDRVDVAPDAVGEQIVLVIAEAPAGAGRGR